MKTKLTAILGAIAIAPAFAQVATTPASHTVMSAPRYNAVMQGRHEHGDGTVTSTNWSGYAITGTDFTKAKASWIVPTLTCNSSGTQYAVFWVGIDGYTSTTVEQTGTEGVCSGSTPVYSAWYEFCCTEPIITIPSINVQPGDKMNATVSYSGGQFTVKITDERNGESYSISQVVSNAQRTSAEFIAEAPSSFEVLPLADYGTVLFGQDNTSITHTCGAIDSSHSGTIGSFPSSSIEEITMEKGGVMESIPSALSSDGKSFSVTWAAQ